MSDSENHDSRYSGVYEKLPDTEGYLRHLGIYERPEPTLESLDRLIHAHLCIVPYENLEYTRLRRCPDLSTVALYDKIVKHNRGGYCFELNGLFYSLLEALGYDIYPVACRMRFGFGLLPMCHRATIVTIDGEKHFADVGTTGLTGLKSVPYNGVSEYGIYIKQSGPDTQVCRKNASGEEECLISYTDVYYDPVDFIPLNYYTSIGPAGGDRSEPIVNIATPTGSLTLNGYVLKVRDGDAVTEITLKSEAEFQIALKKYFGIELPTLPPWPEMHN